MATPVITTLRPLARQQGVQIPGLLPAAQWIDCVALSAGVASAYTLPAGTIFRLTCNVGPIYINFNGTAAVATAKTDGTASIMLRTDLVGSMLIAAPSPVPTTLSIFSAATAVLTIEVWS